MTTAEPEASRLKLLGAGFSPLPLLGKRPILDGWQKCHDPTREEIARWSRTSPAALNTGILTRTAPAFDVDILDPDAAEALENLVRERFEEHGAVLVRFGKRPKRAILFRAAAPFGKITASFDGPTGERLEFLADGQQIACFGEHPESHQPYCWFGGEPGQVERTELALITEGEAQELVADAARLLVGQFGYRLAGAKPRSNGGGDGPADWGFTADDLVDHDRLAALAMRLVASKMDPGAVVNFLRAQIEALVGVDEERRKRRLKEIPAMVESAAAKIERERNPQPEAEPTPLDEVVAVFNDCFALRDNNAVYVTLGAIAANLLEGRDPVWLGLVAPPSSAKTELLNSLSRLPFVHDVDTFGPAGLLSGTPRKDKAKDAHGGVLRKIGDFGILLFKDFGSLLDLRHEHRSDMMAALRRIYDGQYTRQIGAEGGRTLEWRGKAGAIFAATQAYDGFHAVVGTLGDRFLLYRVATAAEEQLTKSRLAPGEHTDVRQRVAAAVAGLFAGLPDPLPTPGRMTNEEYAALSIAIREIVRLRAGIVRDRFRREIDEVHDPEGPARLSIALQQLFAGLLLIGVKRETAAELVTRVAYDSAPQLRLKAFRTLTDSPQTTRDIANALSLPTITARRALEDLAAQRLAVRDEDDDGDEKAGGAHRWRRAK